MNSTLKIIGLFLAMILLISISTFGFLQGFSSDSGTGLSKNDVEKIVAEYIKGHPEAIIASVTQYQKNSVNLEEQKTQKQVVEKRDIIENDPTSPVIGNKNGDVTLVEFFDYSCGYCKKVFPYVMELIKSDPNLKVVLKEFPILGKSSTLASKAAIAVNIESPEKYLEVHKALMKTRIKDLDGVKKVLAESGVDVEKIVAKMNSDEVNSIINKNRELAGQIGIRGTPAFVIDGQLVPGAIGFDTMKQMVNDARK